MLTQVLIAAALSIAPATYSWWTGRRIIRSLDDPALPELLLARNRSTTRIVCATLVAAWLVPAFYLAVIAAMLVCFLAVQYPLRRAMFEDTWSFARYLRFAIASSLSGFGFWLYAITMPGIVVDLARSLAPPQSHTQVLLGAVIGALSAIVLVGWHWSSTRVWLALNGGSPLDADTRYAELLPRFRDIVDRSRVASDRRPSIHRYGVSGGHVMNAVALVSLREPAVALSDTLLSRLDADEATAVFAHEIAHHEHYDAARVRKRLPSVLLLALLLGTLPAAQLASPRSAGFATLMILYPIAVIFGLVLGLSKRRAHEIDSDLRAVELTNDPDAMIRGLTKIHHLARLPRRWGHDFERSASHPSLAKRIQAIRARTEIAAAPLGAPTVIRSTNDASCVVLDDERVHWFDGVPADAGTELATLRERAASCRSLAYSELSELRIIGGSPHSLRAADLADQSWSTTIRDDDVARLQATLDHIDGKLGSKPVEPAWRGKGIARLVAVSLAIATTIAGLSPMIAFVALAVVIAPTVQAFAAMAAMTTAGMVAILAQGAPDLSFQRVAAAVAIGLTLWIASIAWSWPRGARGAPSNHERLGARLTFVVLGLSVVALVLLVVDDGPASLRELIASSWALPLSVALTGTGAALLTVRGRSWRVAGGVAAAIGAMGTTSSLAADRLLPSPSAVAWRDGRLSLVTTVPVEGSVSEVELSPHATRYLTKRLDREDDGFRMVYRYTTGAIPPERSSRLSSESNAPRGSTRALVAIDAALVGEDRLLALISKSADSLELRLEDLERDSAHAVLWRRTLPILRAPHIRVLADARGWQVRGELRSGAESSRPGGHFVSMSGPLEASDEMRRTDISADTLRGSAVFAYDDGTTLLSAVTVDRLPNEAHPMLGAMRAALFGTPMHWALWRYDQHGKRIVTALRGTVNCGAGSGSDLAVCVETSTSGVRVWSVNRLTGTAEVTTISHGFEEFSVGRDGLVVSTSANTHSLAVLDVATRRGLQVPIPARDFDHIVNMHVTPDGVAVLFSEGNRQRLALYRLESDAERVAIQR